MELSDNEWLFERNPQPMVIYDQETLRFLAANDAALRMYQYTADEMQQLAVPQIAAEPHSLLAYLRSAPSEDRVSYTEHRRKDGGLLRLQVISHPVEYRGRAARCVLLLDQTQSLRAEQVMTARARRYSAAFAHATWPMAMVSGNLTTIHECNRAFAQLIGAEVDDIVGKNLLSLTLREDRNLHLPYLIRVEAGELESFHIDKRMLTRAGDIVPTRMHCVLLPATEEQPAAYLLHAQDLSAQLQAEQLSSDLQSRLKAILRYSNEATQLLGADGRLLYVSPSGERILGRSAEELMKSDWREFVHPEDLHRCEQLFARLLETPQEVVRGSYRYLHGDQSWRWYEATGTNLLHEPSLRAVVVTFREVTAEKLAEDTLRESEERYRAVVEQSSEGIFVFDAHHWRIIDANPAFLKMMGYSREQILQVSIFDLVNAPEEQVEGNVRQVVEQRKFRLGQRLYRKADGGELLVEVSASLIEYGGRQACSVVVRDMTEWLRLEQELRQAQKMESIGRLAGGVAHDFNNLLTVILGYSELLLLSEESNPVQEAVGLIHQSATRAAELTRQLLAFSRKQVLVPQILDLNSRTHSMHAMLQRLIGENIELLLSTEADPALVRADPSQIEQVILNLVVNSRDAMPGGGLLWMRTHRLRVLASNFLQLEAGEYVVFSATDTGIGMDEKTQSAIFEPFFTTKGDQGTGLGLATVYGVVKQSGGTIQVDSSLGAGTTFSVFLPACTPQGTALPAPSREEQPTLDFAQAITVAALTEEEESNNQLVSCSQPNASSKLLLVTAQHAQTRRALRRMLEGAGYAVRVAVRFDDSLQLDSLSFKCLISSEAGDHERAQLAGLPSLLLGNLDSGAGHEQPNLLLPPVGPGSILRWVREALHANAPAVAVQTAKPE